MRISDWSSDVCSSDLAGISGRGPKPAGEGRREPARELTRAQRHRVQLREIDKPPGEAMMQDDPIAVYRIAGGGHGLVHGRGPCDERAAAGQWRSEEHTYELVTNAHLVCRLLLETKQPRKQTPTQ